MSYESSPPEERAAARRRARVLRGWYAVSGALAVASAAIAHAPGSAVIRAGALEVVPVIEPAFARWVPAALLAVPVAVVWLRPQVWSALIGSLFSAAAVCFLFAATAPRPGTDRVAFLWGFEAASGVTIALLALHLFVVPLACMALALAARPAGLAPARVVRGAAGSRGG